MINKKPIEELRELMPELENGVLLNVDLKSVNDIFEYDTKYDIYDAGRRELLEQSASHLNDIAKIVPYYLSNPKSQKLLRKVVGLIEKISSFPFLPKVIVAEDDSRWSEMYVDKLQDRFPKVHVDVVETGKELVSHVLEGNYSLIISDNDMEDRNDGLKALETIRESGDKIPFYIISGSERVEECALQEGATGFYCKGSFDSDTNWFSNEVLENLAKHLED